MPEPTQSFAQRQHRYLGKEGLRSAQEHKENSVYVQKEGLGILSAGLKLPPPCAQHPPKHFPTAPGVLLWMAIQIYGYICCLGEAQESQRLLLFAGRPACRLCLNWKHPPATGNPL